jgi:hypothetical protein
VQAAASAIRTPDETARATKGGTVILESFMGVRTVRARCEVFPHPYAAMGKWMRTESMHRSGSGAAGVPAASLHSAATSAKSVYCA